MSAKSGNRSKHKRSVSTTLGKAPSNTNTEYIDLSHLRKPIDTSIFGLRQILSLFETATDEVRRYIAYECELMFECRICRTVFRSLANFILHKRNYCQEVFNPITSNNKADFENNNLMINKDCSPSSDEKTAEDGSTAKRYPKRNLSLVLKKLSDKQECQKFVEDALNGELGSKSCVEEGNEEELSNIICLEGIKSNNEGVFQTANYKQAGDDLMKSEVMEIHSILNSNEAILGPDGKAFTFKTEINDAAGQKLICTVCHLKFATKKTLTHHIKYKHNNTRVVYICPECKDTFANAWCVFRHLYKVHHKTSAQIRRMRDQIHTSAIVKKQDSIKKKLSTLPEEENHESQQLHDLQDYESQLCGSCGRRFERKVALHSHVQMCLKRLSVNTEKEIQKISEDDKIVKQKDVAKGSRKRKSEVAKKILKVNNELQQISEECACDTEKNINKCEINKNLDDVNENCVGEIDVPHCDKSKKAVDYKKYLIQEIILGSRDTTPTDITVDTTSHGNKFVGLVSDEDILGFLKGTSILTENKQEAREIMDNVISQNNEESPSVTNESEENMDCIGTESISHDELRIGKTKTQQVIKSNTIEMLNENSDCFKNNHIEPDILIVNDEIITSDMEGEQFSKMYAPRQYTSKRTRSNMLVKSVSNDNLCITNSEKEVNNEKTECNNVHNNTVDIDLPIDVPNSHVTMAAEYHTSEMNDMPYSSDSESCSCFSDKSNDSSISCESNSENKIQSENHLKNTVVDTIDLIEDDFKADSVEIEKRGMKRKGSLDVARDETLDVLFREKCNSYVNWDKLYCEPCAISFSADNDLLRHMSLHFNWHQYECVKCNYMAYDELLCKEHECIHNINSELNGALVIPIPHRQTLQMTTLFTPIRNNVNEQINEDTNITCNLNKINTKDPSLRKMIMEVIFGTQEDINEAPIASATSRPIRNRVSIKSVQKDFVYDMKEIDLNVRKVPSETKVKPIKIVKNNETNFRVINMSGSQEHQKKKRTL